MVSNQNQEEPKDLFEEKGMDDVRPPRENIPRPSRGPTGPSPSANNMILPESNPDIAAEPEKPEEPLKKTSAEPASPHTAPSGPKPPVGRMLALSIGGLAGLLILIFAGVSLVKGEMYWARDLLGFGLPKDGKKAAEKIIKVSDAQADKITDYKMEVSYNEFSGSLSGKMSIKGGNYSVSMVPAVPDNAVEEIAKSEGVDEEELSSFIGGLNVEIRKTGDKLYANVPNIVKDNWVDFGSLGQSDESFKNLLMSGLDQHRDKFERLSDEKIDGVPCYHFKADLGDEMSTVVDFWARKKDYLIIKDIRTANLGELMGLSGIDLSAELKTENRYSSFGNVAEITVPDNVKDVSVLAEDDFADNMFVKKYILPYSGEMGQAQLKARDARRKADLQEIRTALEQYLDDNNQYPVGNGNSKDKTGIWSDSHPLKDYIQGMPTDPLPDKYYYTYNFNGKIFTLTCVLEAAEGDTDRGVTKKGDLYIYTLTSEPEVKIPENL